MEQYSYVSQLEDSWKSAQVDSDLGFHEDNTPHSIRRSSTEVCHSNLMRLGGYVKEWKDYSAFKKDMGVMPRSSVLGKKDMSKPHGPANSYWKPRG